MMISMIVLVHPLRLACAASQLAVRRSRTSGSVAAASSASLPGSALHLRELRLPARLMRWNIRAQVILSMQTSIDLPDSQRVEQCSTKSSASLSSRSSAVMTS